MLCFGGTKNGMLYGEAVVFLDASLATGASYLQKQVTQLPSKMRFISAQFEAVLSDGLWLRTAAHANEMARTLAASVATIESLGCATPQANSLYPVLPRRAADALQAWSFFYPWNASTNQYRWMTAWDTSPDDVSRFAAGVRNALGQDTV